MHIFILYNKINKTNKVKTLIFYIFNYIKKKQKQLTIYIANTEALIAYKQGFSQREK